MGRSRRHRQRQLSFTDTRQWLPTAAESAFQVFFKPAEKLRLSEHFRELLDKLPAKYSDNKPAYDSFVAKFGTHYFEMANFGGFMYQRTVIDNQFTESTSEKEIGLNLKASFKV